MENNPTWMPVVAAALHDDAGRWLMHKRPIGKAHGGLWEFPGGKVEPEEVPENALVREIGEELGIRLNACDLRPATFAQERGAERRRPIVILLYTVRAWTGEPRALEGGEVGWFTPQQVMDLPRPPLDIALCERLFAQDTRV